MSRTRTYSIPKGGTFNLVNLPGGGNAGILPFTNIYNINARGYGQYPNQAGSITQSTFFMGSYMSKLSIGSTANLTASEITIVGTDILGNVVTESLFGPLAAGKVTSSKMYCSVTSISIATDYTNIVITNTNKWVSSFFVPDIERTFFNLSVSFSQNPAGTASFQLYGTVDELFPTLPVPYISGTATTPAQPNVAISNLTAFQLFPTTSGDFQSVVPSFFNLTTPYTALWVQSNPNDSCEGLIVNFLQQGVV